MKKIINLISDIIENSKNITDATLKERVLWTLEMTEYCVRGYLAENFKRFEHCIDIYMTDAEKKMRYEA